MIRLYFGNIRCGKTTSICRDIKKRQKATRKKEAQTCFANFQQSLCCYDFDIKTLGENWTFPPGSHVHIDEAGIDLNNRNYKNLPQSFIKYMKLSGHYQVDIDFWSQSWEDVDITVRRLASELWYVQKLGPFTMLRKVDKKVMIDEQTHQIVDGYHFPRLILQLLPFPFHRHVFELYLRAPYYKYFDTHAAPPLPIIDDNGAIHSPELSEGYGDSPHN